MSKTFLTGIAAAFARMGQDILKGLDNRFNFTPKHRTHGRGRQRPRVSAAVAIAKLPAYNKAQLRLDARSRQPGWAKRVRA